MSKGKGLLEAMKKQVDAAVMAGTPDPSGYIARCRSLLQEVDYIRASHDSLVAEIEQLRAAYDSAQKACIQWRDDVDLYRAALERIANVGGEVLGGLAKDTLARADLKQ